MDITTTPRAGATQTLAIRFTGSGSEYFRIWIVNLGLTLLTLSLYWPWAKARKLRYFHGNTVVGGHALDFHGEPWRMLRGYLLVALLFLLYSQAGNFSALAGGIALLIMAAVWPALFRASMQFRLANTSWRGLRFAFDGDLPGAYMAMLALFVPAIGFVVLGAFAPEEGDPAGDAFLAAFSLLVVSSLLAVPLLLWLLKRYQHGHYVYGSVRTRLDAGAGAFLAAGLKIAGVALLAGLLAAGLAGAAMWSMLSAKSWDMAIIVLIAPFLALQLIVQPYAASRLQNLVWARTSGHAVAGPSEAPPNSRALRFDSRLRWMPLMQLTLKNWALVVLTLGLYWPFAAIALARMRLESMSIQTSVDLDAIAGRRGAGAGDASGDAAGDLFGIDIGM